MLGSFNLDSFRDGWKVVVLYGVASRICSMQLAAFLPSSLFSICLVSVRVVHPYSSIDTTTAWKKLHFILSVRSNFHITDNLSIAVLAFASCVLMSISVDETLLPREVNVSTCFKGLSFSLETLPLCQKHVHSILSTLTWRPAPRSR